VRDSLSFSGIAVKSFIVLSFALNSVGSVGAAGPADEAAIRNAWTLYTQQKYVPSADAFEALIRTSTPSSRLYYYAAAANKAAGRLPRAKQLCDYVSANFSTSAEAGYVQKLFPSDVSKPAAAAPAGLPSHLKDKSVDELMQTEEGRQALLSAVSKPAAGAPAATKTATTSTASRTVYSPSKSRPKDTVFTADIIAIEGADGITQFVNYPDAGFECSLAAMAMLTRGREILADMITCPSHQDVYIVRFPNNAGEHTITPAKMEKYMMKDKALWAAIIHGAVRETNLVHSFEDGLSLLTGHKAEKILANNTTQSALASFISDAISKQYPVVCLSSDSSPSPELVEWYHGFTITGYDAASGMITLRNPHGNNSRRFRMETDPNHKKFEQLNGGFFKIHISLFPLYFKEVARSQI
jgi:hypothetical protein